MQLNGKWNSKWMSQVQTWSKRQFNIKQINKALTDKIKDQATPMAQVPEEQHINLEAILFRKKHQLQLKAILTTVLTKLSSQNIILKAIKLQLLNSYAGSIYLTLPLLIRLSHLLGYRSSSCNQRNLTLTNMRIFRTQT